MPAPTQISGRARLSAAEQQIIDLIAGNKVISDRDVTPDAQTLLDKGYVFMNRTRNEDGSVEYRYLDLTPEGRNYAGAIR